MSKTKCPHCSHIQLTNSQLLYITCSSCQKKYPRVYNEIQKLVKKEK